MNDRLIAGLLLDAKAVTFYPKEPFTYTSGLKAPVYIDNRALTGLPAIRKQVATGLTDLVRNNYPRVEVIAGTATAGIAWAAWIADALDLPMVYVRSDAKSHGKHNQIEGALDQDASAVIVEDHISSGSSALNAAAALQETGCSVLGVVAITTYQLEKSVKAFAEADIPLHSLTNFRSLTSEAVGRGLIEPVEESRVLDWAADPEGWAAHNGFDTTNA